MSALSTMSMLILPSEYEGDVTSTSTRKTPY